ncbi:MAG: Dabb family protein [Lachnospiraceae bacterium]|nr:Dabb family protein [Lachnospiraceae bacterium]
MIRHICMFTLQEANKEKTISEFFKRAEKLKELDIIKKFKVVKNAEKTPDSNYDVALIFDFDTVETLNQYQKSPQHLEFGEFVYSVRIDRACIDYEF